MQERKEIGGKEAVSAFIEFPQDLAVYSSLATNSFIAGGFAPHSGSTLPTLVIFTDLLLPSVPSSTTPMAKKYYPARATLYSSTAVFLYELTLIATEKARDSAAELGLQRKPMFARKPPSEPSLYRDCPVGSANSREIRLLFLRPAGSVLERVKCQMKTFSLDDPEKPLYTALSYTWGEPIRRSRPLSSLRGLYQEARTLFWRYCLPQRRTILINGESFSVSRNLATALRFIREDKGADVPLD